MGTRLDSALGDYLKQIKSYPLLTPEEERELGRTIRAAMDAERRLERGEIDIAEYERLQLQAAQARDRMVQGNLRLVISVAKNFRHRGLPLEDLVNEGNVGLMNAVDRFDPEMGSRFSTYASYWIDQAMRRALQSTTNMIHIPSYLMEQIGRLKLAARELEEKLGRQPTLEELAERMKISPRKVVAISQAIRACNCPTQSSASEQGDSVTESIPDTRTPPPFEAVVTESDADLVSEALSTIDEREALVLKLRYGLGPGGRRMTLKEIGEQIGLTRERVRQIERQAKRKLVEYIRGEPARAARPA